MNIPRLFAIAGTEFKRMIRDRPSLSLLLVLPAIQILLFGGAIRLEPHQLPIALIGSAPVIEAAARAIAAEPRLDIAYRAASGDPLATLRDGRVVIAISTDRGGTIRIDADGADPVTARAAVAIVEQVLLDAAGQALPLPKVTVSWAFNPDQHSAWVILPGLGGAIVMIAMLLLGAQSIVREREEGGWEALLLSPMSGAEFIGGKLLPYLPIAVSQAGMVLLIGAGLFGLPLGYGALALLALTLPFAAAYLAWGLVISALARNRLQAIQGAMFLYLPSILLSGFLFPFAAMPGWAQAIGSALPLTHFVRASRDLLLRGAPPSAAWRAVPPLLICAALGCSVALLLWRGRIPPLRGRRSPRR